jgi:sugar phosphate isomerase/epimerase
MTLRERKEVSRRKFLRRGAAGMAAMVGAGCVRKPPPAAPPAEPAEAGTQSSTTPVVQPPPPPPPPPWSVDLGIQSYSLRNTKKLEDVVKQTQQLGLHFIELFPGHLPMNVNADQLAAAQALLASHEVTANAYGVCGLGKNVAQARKLFEFAKKAGIGFIPANPSPDCFDVLDPLVEEYDLRIGIHNHGPGSRWTTADQMLKALEDHHPHIGVCLDTGHLERAKDDPVAAVRKLGPRLHGLHVKDTNAQGHDVVLGTGRTDIPGLLAALKAISFRGVFSIEYELQPNNPLPGMTQSIAYVRKTLDALNQA